jgi:hypothetical protein
MYYNNALKKNLDLHPLCNDARNALDNDVILHYRTFTQYWGNGGGIWCVEGGIYTQGFINDKVSIFYGKRGSVAVYVGKTLVYVINHPNETFKDDVHNKNMALIRDAKDRYEK